MPSNSQTNQNTTAGDTFVTKQRAHDGDTAQQQGVFLSGVVGTEDSYTFVDLQVQEENAAAPATVNGIAPMFERDDALSTLTPAEGDMVHGRVDDQGALWVNVRNAEGTATDDAAFTAGTGTGVPLMGFASSDTVNAGDVGVLAMSTDRRLLVDANISDNGGTITVDGTVGVSGTVAVTDNGGSLTVDGTVTANLSATDNAVLDSIDAAVNGTQTVAGTVTANLGATDNAVLDNIQTNTANTATAVQLLDNAIAGSEMQVDVVASLPAGTNNIGDVDIASAIPAGANLIGDVGIGVRTSGGTSFFNSNDLDETEEQVSGVASQLYWITAFNVSGSILYLQVFNNTAAGVTVGTTAPDMVFPLPTTGTADQGSGFVLSVPNGIEFGTAITVAATTTPTGATGPGANEVIVNIGYA